MSEHASSLSSSSREDGREPLGQNWTTENRWNWRFNWVYFQLFVIQLFLSGLVARLLHLLSSASSSSSSRSSQTTDGRTSTRATSEAIQSTSFIVRALGNRQKNCSRESSCLARVIEKDLSRLGRHVGKRRKKRKDAMTNSNDWVSQNKMWQPKTRANVCVCVCE